MVGQTLGHYRILELLGKGGMGEVYRAEDTTLERQVALKILPPDLAESERRLSRFQREAKTLAALDHPSIVTIHSVEEADGVHFLTMQLVEGKPLSELIPLAGMPVDRLFDIAIPLADALAAAHDTGIIHRDLKPANIMVTDDGRVMVLDFGLAKLRHKQPTADFDALASETLTLEGTIVGTLPYMSPEQLEGGTVDARSDIFSLGAILFEMATGQRPFRGSSSISIISAIVKDNPVEIDQVRDDIPHHLGRIVRHCLEKDADERFQTAKDVRNQLEDLSREISSSHSQADASTNARSRFSWSKRRSIVALLAVLVVLTTLALIVRRARAPAAPPDLGPITSIAVLPLQNLSGDPGQEYFADGMTEALIASLAKISALKVISRTSVMRFKGVTKPLGEIASDLGVDALVEGSVIHADSRVRVTALLIHAATDQPLWSRSYDRDLLDILSLQSEVAQSIADEIEVRITPEEQLRLRATQQIDPEAYRAYLQGRFHWNLRTSESLSRARDFFQRASELEPDWAAAYAGLSDSYSLMAAYGFLAPMASSPLASAAAKRAIQADETNPEAHASLAWVNFTFDWDWQGSEDHFQRAIELNPSYATARHWYALYLAAMGRDHEALTQIELAQELDPLSPIIASNEGWIDYFAGRFQSASEKYSAVLTTDPMFPPALWKLAQVYGAMGRLEEALALNLQGMDRFGWDASQRAQLLAYSGRQDEARSELVDLTVARQTSYVSPFELAAGFAAVADHDEALLWLSRALEERDGGLAFLLVDPRFDGLRQDPRFVSLLETMKFPT